ncbi:MAG TPA: pentapeptide repeat-containing protein [Pseudonocardiaceae bacterium]|nr:pentapeptide repeat-containing protein [Pseudonocardiaceae bacterium]
MRRRHTQPYGKGTGRTRQRSSPRRGVAWPAPRVGLVIMLVGLAVLTVGHVHQHGWTWTGLIDDLYANVGLELVGMAFVILLIDRFAARREDERRRHQLVRELASTDRGLTARAVIELDAQGWLYDDTLVGAQLSGANLAGARLERANLQTTILAGADLTHANLSGARMAGANLTDAVLDRANLEMADLSGAILPQARLARVDAALATLTTANLEGADLHDADLTGADLRGADLRGADLAGCRLGRASLDGVRWDTTTRWPEGFSPPPGRDDGDIVDHIGA